VESGVVPDTSEISGGWTVTTTSDALLSVDPAAVAPAEAPSGFEGSQAEWNSRVDLAACYRIIAFYGWDDLVATHISARVPGEDDAFLINDFGLMFEEITASSLVKVNLAGEVLAPLGGNVNPAGFTIHSAVYQVRNDVGAAIHLHTIDGMAVSTSADGLLPLTQTAMTVCGDVAYHDFEGVALDLAEREHLQEHLGLKNNMILRHHGTMSLGDCIATAFARIYQLEQACSAQVRALATRSDLATVDPAAVAKTDEPEGLVAYGRVAWPAVRRKVDRLDPSYRN
jgi:ribulose-5-phosphate 4-epimerase/fuculose-1-phosphate aldolase